MAAVNISIIVLPILILCFLATICVAIFVYKDASKRGMSPLGWCLVAALVPLFIGLIMYLVCRKPLMDLKCPSCGNGVSQMDKQCPQCGRVFVTQCPECKFPVQKGWSRCPSCGSDLPEDFGQPVRTFRKDNGIFALVIIVGVVLLALFFALFSVARIGPGQNYENGYGVGGVEGMYNITAEDMSGNSTIKEWVSSCGTGEDAYVLLSSKSNTCLVYLPGQNALLESYLDLEYYGDNCDAHIQINSLPYEDKYGYDFMFFQFEVKANTKVYVYVDYELCDAKVTVTEEDISMESWGGQDNE